MEAVISNEETNNTQSKIISNNMFESIQVPDSEIKKMLNEINKEIDEQEIINSKLLEKISIIKANANEVNKVKTNFIQKTNDYSKESYSIVLILSFLLGILLSGIINK